ncbi:centrosome-associated zinc finger protein CP190 [Cimex lectularius]|uniref:BTB domain-containing protein n=1 Tax=Cimex lectularius TaxID=79782 RepID=A0A8I6RFT6_CIMLE|nr:centrosome-associated zinc finger protein CP190 [Cimex lectularius]XP_014244490.1 centrosome-associated zinc finger protein CP190 [Cimex lectularius]
MAADTKPNIKQLRVDNWAVFFLQRVQLLFAKGDHCDLTLKFQSGEELKVHRLILNTSTTYFETLESEGNLIELPDTLPYSAVHPIINFLYSGRLEFKPELFNQLLSVAKILNITILCQLLVTQKNDNGVNSTTVGVTKTDVIKRVPLKIPSTSKINKSSPTGKALEGKKLPIWRPRTTLPLLRQFKRKQLEEDDDPKPTRFNWPVDEATNNMMIQSPSFASLSYETSPVIPSPVHTTSSSPPQQQLYKRRIITSTPATLPNKFFKPNKSDENKESNENKEEERPPEVSDDDDDDGHFETLHTYGDSDDDLPQEPMTNQLKPILKPPSEAPTPTPNKKVRFSFVPEEKDKENELEPEKPVETVAQKPAASVQPLVVEKVEKIEPVSNHAKIIAEVLKKYPELVKNNKNIKLKITAPGFAQKTNTISMTTKKASHGKSSYVVIKSSVKPKETSSVTKVIECKIEESNNSKPVVNSGGSWTCSFCSTEENSKFDSYFEYRKHLENIHNERVDARVCEYCGYKASKRNLHLFHLYSKHGVPPPKNIKFPKCDQCCYIALNEGLLIKHLNSHQAAKDLTCPVCNLMFKTASSLQAHSVTCKAENDIRDNSCPHCKKKFKTNNNLNIHIKICTEKSNNQGSNIFDEVEAEDRSMDVIDVPIIETVKVNDQDHSLVELPSGLILTDQPNVALFPSSESEALNNVASGIATSIGLTVALPQDPQQAVILLDGNSDFFIEGHNSVVVANESGDYIVPEMLDNNMAQMYSTPYSVGPETETVIPCSIESTQSNEEMQNPEPESSNNVGNKEDTLEEKAESCQNISQRISLETPVIFDNELENDIIDGDLNVENTVENKGSPMIMDELPEVSNVQIENEKNDLPSQIPVENPHPVLEDVAQNPENSKENEIVKANTLVKDWGFDNDEENEEISQECENTDPDDKPCRINEDL